MTGEPLTFETLLRYHREVLVPEVRQIVGDAVEGSERRLRDEMHSLFDSLSKRLDRLEIEYQMIVAGLKRLEERMDRLEQRMDKLALRSEAQELRARLEVVEKKLAEIEAEL